MSGQGTLARRPEFGPYMSLALAAHARFLDGDSEGALHERRRGPDPDPRRGRLDHRALRPLHPVLGAG